VLIFHGNYFKVYSSHLSFSVFETTIVTPSNLCHKPHLLLAVFFVAFSTSYHVTALTPYMLAIQSYITTLHNHIHSTTQSYSQVDIIVFIACCSTC